MHWSEETLRRLAERGDSPSAQRAALGEALRERSVPETMVAAVLAHCEEAVVLVSGEEPSSSWLGGPGRLPRGESWPRNRIGLPLSPVAHLDLEALPDLAAPFPRTGAISIFHDFAWVDACDPEGTGMEGFPEATCVYLLDSSADFLDPPEDTWTTRRVDLRGILMAVAGQPGRVVSDVGGEPQAAVLIDAMNDLTAGLYGHQLGGRAREFQGDVLDELRLILGEWASATLRDRYSEAELRGDGWRLLATVEADEELMFGDGGNLYIVVPERDLARGRLDRAIGIEQGA